MFTTVERSLGGRWHTLDNDFFNSDFYKHMGSNPYVAICDERGLVSYKDLVLEIKDEIKEIFIPYGFSGGYADADLVYICPDCGTKFYCEVDSDDYVSEPWAYDITCPHCGSDGEDRSECLEDVLDRYHAGKDEGFDFEYPHEERTEHFQVGMELEVDDAFDEQDACDCVRELRNDLEVYCEHDGSLSDYGFEIITHPLTKNSLKNTAEAICKIAKSHGMHSHDTDTCGLHFHLDLGYLTGSLDQWSVDFEYKSELLKAKIFLMVGAMYENSSKLMETIDRRHGAYSYCHKGNVAKETKMTTGEIEKFICAAKNMKEGDRYKVVNTDNKGTVELRFFKGTLNIETLKADIDIAFAIGEMARKITVSEAERMTVRRLYRYILKNKDVYPDAKKYLSNILKNQNIQNK